MDLIQIITILLCVGAIIYLVYQIKELYHAFQDSDNFKDFLANKDYEKERLLKVCNRLTDKNSKVIKENRNLKVENENLKAENKSLKDELEALKNAQDYILDQNRKLKKKLPSSEWLYLD